MNIVNVTVRGISPMLMNRFTEAAEESIRTGRRTSLKKESSPRENAERAAYRTPDGVLYKPPEHFIRSFRAGGKFHKVGRKQADYLVMASMFITETCIEVCDESGKALREFEVDARSGVNPSTKGRVMLYRPRFDKWQCTFTLQVDDDIMSPSLARLIVDDAGKKIGTGDFRPEKGGPFGRFVVTQWD